MDSVLNLDKWTNLSKLYHDDKDVLLECNNCKEVYESKLPCKCPICYSLDSRNIKAKDELK